MSELVGILKWLYFKNLEPGLKDMEGRIRAAWQPN